MNKNNEHRYYSGFGCGISFGSGKGYINKSGDGGGSGVEDMKKITCEKYFLSGYGDGNGTGYGSLDRSGGGYIDDRGIRKYK